MIRPPRDSMGSTGMHYSSCNGYSLQGFALVPAGVLTKNEFLSRDEVAYTYGIPSRPPPILFANAESEATAVVRDHRTCAGRGGCPPLR